MGKGKWGGDAANVRNASPHHNSPSFYNGLISDGLMLAAFID